MVGPRRPLRRSPRHRRRRPPTHGSVTEPYLARLARRSARRRHRPLRRDRPDPGDAARRLADGPRRDRAPGAPDRGGGGAVRGGRQAEPRLLRGLRQRRPRRARAGPRRRCRRASWSWPTRSGATSRRPSPARPPPCSTRSGRTPSPSTRTSGSAPSRRSSSGRPLRLRPLPDLEPGRGRAAGPRRRRRTRRSARPPRRSIAAWRGASRRPASGSAPAWSWARRRRRSWPGSGSSCRASAFLVPGVGAQGGDAAPVLAAGPRDRGPGRRGRRRRAPRQRLAGHRRAPRGRGPDGAPADPGRAPRGGGAPLGGHPPCAIVARPPRGRRRPRRGRVNRTLRSNPDAEHRPGRADHHPRDRPPDPGPRPPSRRGLRPRQEHPRVPQGGHRRPGLREARRAPRHPRPRRRPPPRPPLPPPRPRTRSPTPPAEHAGRRPRRSRTPLRRRSPRPPTPRRAEPVRRRRPSPSPRAPRSRPDAAPARPSWPTPTSRSTAGPRPCPSRRCRRPPAPVAGDAAARRRMRPSCRSSTTSRSCAGGSRSALLAVARRARSSGFVFGQRIIEVLKAPYGDAPLLLLAPGEGFFITLKVAIVVGIVLAMPVILFELWRFVSPGLTSEERRIARPWVPLALRLLRGRRRRRLLRPAVRDRLPVELRQRRPPAPERLDRRGLLRLRGHDVPRLRARDGVPDRARPALEGRDRDERPPAGRRGATWSSSSPSSPRSPRRAATSSARSSWA